MQLNLANDLLSLSARQASPEASNLLKFYCAPRERAKPSDNFRATHFDKSRSSVVITGESFALRNSNELLSDYAHKTHRQFA
jgi:hypothetical protein